MVDGLSSDSIILALSAACAPARAASTLTEGLVIVMVMLMVLCSKKTRPSGRGVKGEVAECCFSASEFLCVSAQSDLTSYCMLCLPSSPVHCQRSVQEAHTHQSCQSISKLSQSENHVRYSPSRMAVAFDHFSSPQLIPSSGLIFILV